MRTTLDIDDDVLQAVKDLSRRRKQSMGLVISELARKSLISSKPFSRDQKSTPFHGIVPFPASGAIVTNEMIDRLKEEEDLY